MSDLPIGAIIAWHRSDDSQRVPDGWAICDGTPVSGINLRIPDLRGKFIRGADDGSHPGTFGGSDSIPSHSHSVNVGNVPFITDPFELGFIHHARSYHPVTPNQPGSLIEVYANNDSNRRHSHYGVTHEAIRSTSPSEDQDNRPEFFSVIYIIKIR